jgi:acyl-CoA reductase-like NAD-dependent aldehyde dehydrogenase
MEKLASGKERKDVDLICQKILHRLAEIKNDAIEVMQFECGYTQSDCLLLFEDTIKYIIALPSLMELSKLSIETQNNFMNSLGYCGQLRQQSWGKTLVVLPSNAPWPLGVIIPLSLSASGNSVEVLASRKIQRSVQLAMNVFDQLSLRIEYNPVSPRDILDIYISEREFDMCYFIGSSQSHEEIARKCAKHGVSLIFEGEGNSSAVVTAACKEKSLTEVASILSEACRFGFGRMCTKPTAVFVHSRIIEEFCFALDVARSRTSLPVAAKSLFDVSDLDRLFRLDTICGVSIQHQLESKSPVFALTSNWTCALEKELYGPGMIISSYEDYDELLAFLKTRPHKLQLSFFGDHCEFKKAETQTGFARYCLNMQPIDQDPRLPWGCYGLSGSSTVLDFYQKGLRTKILESSSINADK